MNRIASTLTRLFERHRILFWYDTKRELRNRRTPGDNSPGYKRPSVATAPGERGWPDQPGSPGAVK
jgi:hypothetical protein